MLNPEETAAEPPGADAATVVLVVDDSPIERRLAGRILEKASGLTVIYAGDGREALEQVESQAPAVVLTDLQMPEMDGLALVEEIRRRYPRIPVALMTAQGSEDIAILALKAGAASYVPKRSLAKDLVETIRQLLAVAAADRVRERLLLGLRRQECVFLLENDPDLITSLIERYLHELAGMETCDATARLRVGVALQEALCNALYHGNLEVSSDLRQEDERVFYDLAERRRTLEPYRSRRIEVRSVLDRDGATFVIRDEGQGFDVAALDRPIEPEDLMRIGGRGILLIRTFMDQVSHNDVGNEITLVKRRKS